MKTRTQKLLAALLGGLALLATLPAQAHGWDRDDGDRWGGGRWEHRDHGRHYGYWRDGYGYGYGGPAVVRERVIVRPAPIVERTVVERAYAPAPYPVTYPAPYAYSRSPSVVIGVQVPPIVIPIR
ncbi:MAG: hypothetical protein HGA47_08870 [Zoogloea sp.]|nr:hypothetical protein [Zoogloea sp.]